MLKGFFSTKGLENEWKSITGNGFTVMRVYVRAQEREGEHHLHQGRYRCSLPAAQHVEKKKKKETDKDRTEAE